MTRQIPVWVIHGGVVLIILALVAATVISGHPTRVPMVLAPFALGLAAIHFRGSSGTQSTE